MLKDQKIIQEVVMNYRNLVTPKFAKLYRLFKSIRKQFINQEENVELERGFNEVLENQMKVIKDQVNEYFNVLDKVKKKKLNFIIYNIYIYRLIIIVLILVIFLN